jgi:eukaryotic-like serine/threonine-protein kinase
LPQKVCDALNVTGGTWNRNDEILFAPNPSSGLFRVSAAGGVLTPVTTLDTAQGEDSHRWPQFLPDGRHFLYLARTLPGRPSPDAPATAARLTIYGGSLDSTDRTEILADTARAQYASGHLLFIRGTTLMAQPFDDTTLQLRGSAQPVAEHVPMNLNNGRTGFAASERLLLHRARDELTYKRVLTWYDRAGTPLSTIGPVAGYTTIRLSPKDRALAVHLTTNSRDL